MAPTMTMEEMQAQIDALRAENGTLKTKASKAGTLSLRVSEKGALSVYGMGRFPVTLYKEQWQKLFLAKETIEAFIEANPGLKSKGVE